MTEKISDMTLKIREVLEKHNASRAGIFGSYVRGEQKEDSDVDILVELDKDLDLVSFIQIKNELEDTLNKKVDLVEYDTIRKELRKDIGEGS